MAPAGQGAPTVTGPVLETMNASSYTYVRVKTDAGDVWAASSEFKVAVGDRITVALEMPMENFHSESLKRDFPLMATVVATPEVRMQIGALKLRANCSALLFPWAVAFLLPTRARAGRFSSSMRPRQ